MRLDALPGGFIVSHQKRLSVPALATYSHSDSLNNRYASPVSRDNHRTYACASCQLTLTTGRGPSPTNPCRWDCSYTHACHDTHPTHQTSPRTHPPQSAPQCAPDVQAPHPRIALLHPTDSPSCNCPTAPQPAPDTPHNHETVHQSPALAPPSASQPASPGAPNAPPPVPGRREPTAARPPPQPSRGTQMPASFFFPRSLRARGRN